MQQRRVGWDSVDQTLSIGLEYGVVQQVGQEIHARVGNTTGVTIPNGTLAGFVGAATDAVLVAPYLANGTQPSSYVIGLMTHDLPDSGQRGYCTTFGFVRNMDTSSFSVGDILYASPTVPGGLTNVKPTAPNNVIRVGVCAVSHATEGVVFVRPTIEATEYYGVFSDTTSQTAAAAYTPRAVTFNTTNSSNGVVVGTPTSRIVVPFSGLYQFAFSAQIESTNSSTTTVWIWPRKNGVDVPNSNSETTISGNSTVLVPAWTWTMTMSAGDYFELMFAVESTNVYLAAKPAAVGANGTVNFARPAVPSILLDVTQIQP